MLLKFFAKLGDLITKYGTPFSQTLKKFRYAEIRSYSATNINLEIVLFVLVLAVVFFGKAPAWYVLLFFVFALVCYMFAVIMDHKEYKMNKELEGNDMRDFKNKRL